MLVLSKESPQGISKYNSKSSDRLSFTWKKDRAYLDSGGSYNSKWLLGSPWVGTSGWHHLAPIEILVWSDENE